MLYKSQWIDFVNLHKDIQAFLFDSKNQSVFSFPSIIAHYHIIDIHQKYLLLSHQLYMYKFVALSLLISSLLLIISLFLFAWVKNLLNTKIKSLYYADKHYLNILWIIVLLHIVSHTDLTNSARNLNC